MRKLNDYAGIAKPPFVAGEWCTYCGPGTSVVTGTRGKITRVFTDQVEVEFDCGTTLVTDFANVLLAPPPRPGGFYGDWWMHG